MATKKKPKTGRRLRVDPQRRNAAVVLAVRVAGSTKVTLKRLARERTLHQRREDRERGQPLSTIEVADLVREALTLYLEAAQ